MRILQTSSFGFPFGYENNFSFFEKRRVFNGGNSENEVTKKHTPEYGVQQMTPELQAKMLLETQVTKILDLKSLKNKTEFKTKLESLKNGISHPEKNTEIIPRAEIVFEIIEKKIQKLSAQKLLMIEDIFPGTLKKLFIKDGGVIDFQGNKEAENVIGMGDIMPLSQTYIVIYDEKTGEWESGVRGIKNTSLGIRPAYINIGASEKTEKSKKPASKTGDYIEIYDNYKVVEVSGKNGADKFKKDVTNSDLKKSLKKDEAIFDEKITNKKGEEVNSDKDIALNDKAKSTWEKQSTEIKEKKQYYYSENINLEDFSSRQDLIDMALSQEIPKDSIKTFLYAMGKETGKNSSLLDDDRFIRTRVKPKPGKRSSTAFGPVQITVSLAISYAKKKGVFNSEEQVFLKRFISQGQKMLKSPADDPIYGFGGTGESYFREPKNKVLYFQMAMKMFHDHVDESGSPEKGLQWWRWGKYGAKKNKGKDLQYFRGLQDALRKPLPVRKKIEKPSAIEKVLYAKKDISPYIDPRKSDHRSMKRNLENTLKISGYPDSLFIKNVNKNERYTPEEIQEITKTVKQLYIDTYGESRVKENPPLIYIDNENGVVQRITRYPEISDQKENLDTLSQFLITEKDIESGKISLGELEATLKKFPNYSEKIISAYAKIRVAQEKSLGLNSISLVLDKGGNDTYMKSRGFRSPKLRMQYANALIEEAETSNMQVMLKHFPGHYGLENPHLKEAGIKGGSDSEMQTFLSLLSHNSDKKNITVMLGHIKINVDGWKEYKKGYTETGDEKEDKKHLLVASQSKIVADTLRSIHPNIKLISDDIAGMKASGDIKKARKNAQ